MWWCKCDASTCAGLPFPSHPTLHNRPLAPPRTSSHQTAQHRETTGGEDSDTALSSDAFVQALYGKDGSLRKVLGKLLMDSLVTICRENRCRSSIWCIYARQLLWTIAMKVLEDHSSPGIAQVAIMTIVDKVVKSNFVAAGRRSMPGAYGGNGGLGGGGSLVGGGAGGGGGDGVSGGGGDSRHGIGRVGSGGSSRGGAAGGGQHGAAQRFAREGQGLHAANWADSPSVMLTAITVIGEMAVLQEAIHLSGTATIPRMLNEICTWGISCVRTARGWMHKGWREEDINRISAVITAAFDCIFKWVSKGPWLLTMSKQNCSKAILRFATEGAGNFQNRRRAHFGFSLSAARLLQFVLRYAGWGHVMRDGVLSVPEGGEAKTAKDQTDGNMRHFLFNGNLLSVAPRTLEEKEEPGAKSGRSGVGARVTIRSPSGRWCWNTTPARSFLPLLPTSAVTMTGKSQRPLLADVEEETKVGLDDQEEQSEDDQLVRIMIGLHQKGRPFTGDGESGAQISRSSRSSGASDADGGKTGAQSSRLGSGSSLSSSSSSSSSSSTSTSRSGSGALDDALALRLTDAENRPRSEREHDGKGISHHLSLRNIRTRSYRLFGSPVSARVGGAGSEHGHGHEHQHDEEGGGARGKHTREDSSLLPRFRSSCLLSMCITQRMSHRASTLQREVVGKDSVERERQQGVFESLLVGCRELEDEAEKREREGGGERVVESQGGGEQEEHSSSGKEPRKNISSSDDAATIARRAMSQCGLLSLASWDTLVPLKNSPELAEDIRTLDCLGRRERYRIRVTYAYGDLLHRNGAQRAGVLTGRQATSPGVLRGLQGEGEGKATCLTVDDFSKCLSALCLSDLQQQDGQGKGDDDDDNDDEGTKAAHIPEISVADDDEAERGGEHSSDKGKVNSEDGDDGGDAEASLIHLVWNETAHRFRPGTCAFHSAYGAAAEAQSAECGITIIVDPMPTSGLYRTRVIHSPSSAARAERNCSFCEGTTLEQELDVATEAKDAARVDGVAFCGNAQSTCGPLLDGAVVSRKLLGHALRATVLQLCRDRRARREEGGS